VAVDGRVLAGSLRRILMDGDGWLQVPLAIHSAHSADWSAIVPGIEGTMAVTNSLYLGMSLSVMCAEEAPRIRRRDYRAETTGTLMAHWPAEAILGACELWDEGTAAEGYDQPVAVDVPILALSGALDPSTPAFWGQYVADSAPNALHLVMEGVSHSPFPDCAQGVMADFVEAGSLKGLDTSCIGALRRGRFRLP
jgi:pimeloyl-ACP methyl ester carboxylesterase